jgi:hypothetical protein
LRRVTGIHLLGDYVGPGVVVAFWRRKISVEEIRTPDHAALNVVIFSGKFLGYLYSFTVGGLFYMRKS